MKKQSNKPNVWLIILVILITFAAPFAAVMAALHFQ